MLKSILSRYANFAEPVNVTYSTHSSCASSFVHSYGDVDQKSNL